MQRALVLCDGDLIRQPHIVFEPPCSDGSEHTEESGSGSASPVSRGPSGAGFAPSGAMGAGSSGALAESLAQAEQRLILQVLRAHISRERAAAHLGISARTLRYKLARMRAAGVAVDGSEGEAS